MEFQKSKIICLLENNDWSFGDSYKPHTKWPYFEILVFTKRNVNIYLALYRDPTNGYLHKQLKRNKVKFYSSDYDILVYDADPNLRAKSNKISEINLGKGWEAKLPILISDCENFLKLTNP